MNDEKVNVSLKIPKAQKVKSIRIVRLILAVFIVLCIFPIPYYILPLVNINTFIFILTGIIVIAFALFFLLLIRANDKPYKGKRYLRKEFGLKNYDENETVNVIKTLDLDNKIHQNMSLGTVVGDVRVLVVFSYIWQTGGESYDADMGTIHTVPSKKIDRTYLFIGEEIVEFPPKYLQNLGVRLKNNVWIWEGRKDVSDDYKNLSLFIKEMIKQIKMIRNN